MPKRIPEDSTNFRDIISGKARKALEERWHVRNDDECGWIPIRPPVDTENIVNVPVPTFFGRPWYKNPFLEIAILLFGACGYNLNQFIVNHTLINFAAAMMAFCAALWSLYFVIRKDVIARRDTGTESQGPR